MRIPFKGLNQEENGSENSLLSRRAAVSRRATERSVWAKDSRTKSMCVSAAARATAGLRSQIAA
jgi:hypothetical protein